MIPLSLNSKKMNSSIENFELPPKKIKKHPYFYNFEETKPINFKENILSTISENTSQKPKRRSSFHVKKNNENSEISKMYIKTIFHLIFSKGNQENTIGDIVFEFSRHPNNIVFCIYFKF